jgi:GT2 family glycosyltransferase/tetratricopeptide (TPR) repeat protein
MPAFNNYFLTRRAIQSIRNCTSDFEVILIDNGSTDETESVFGSLAKQVPCLEYVRNDVNIGFTKALNQGLARAQGKYCIWLNNDVMVTEYWADKMASHIQCSAEQVGVDRIGIVGPVSNAVAGSQLLDIPWYKPDLVHQVALDVWRANTHKAFLADFVSGFCLMHPKALLDEIGFPDESYSPGGYEDNDFVLRAREKGIYSVIAADTFVHHDMSATMRFPEFKHYRGGLINTKKFYSNWLSPKNQRLTTVYTCNNITDIFIQSLLHSAAFSDHVVVILDGVKDDGTKLTSLAPPNISFFDLDKKVSEFERRTFAYQKALQTNCDWILCLDSDEMLESKVNKAYMQRLMRHPNPQVRFIGFPVFNLWDTEDTWRVDGAWGEMHGPRMFRVLPGLNLVSPNKTGLHMFHTPQPTIEGTRYASAKILHYGYVREEDRLAKFRHYTAQDTSPDPSRVGGDSYEHLISNSYTLHRYKGPQTVSFNMLYNGEFVHTVQLLDMLYAAVDDIHIQANADQDGAFFIGKIFNCPVHIDKFNNDFAKARNKLKSKSTADWILYLDPDEIMHPAFPKTLQRLIEDDVDGFLFTFENHHEKGAPTYSDSIRLFKNRKEFKFRSPVHENLDDAFKSDRYRIAQLPWTVIHLGATAGYKTETKTIQYYEKLNERAIRENPDSPLAHFNMALCHLHRKDNLTARNCFLRAADLDKNYYHPRLQLGLMSMVEARDRFFEVQSIIPEHHRLYGQVQHVLDLLVEAIGNNDNGSEQHG